MTPDNKDQNRDKNKQDTRKNPVDPSKQQQGQRRDDMKQQDRNKK